MGIDDEGIQGVDSISAAFSLKNVTRSSEICILQEGGKKTNFNIPSCPEADSFLQQVQLGHTAIVSGIG